jgi:hypothetical protein
MKSVKEVDKNDLTVTLNDLQLIYSDKFASIYKKGNNLFNLI